MNDLPQRLRLMAQVAPDTTFCTTLVPGGRDILNEAADEIERLRALIDASADQS